MVFKNTGWFFLCDNFTTLLENNKFNATGRNLCGGVLTAGMPDGRLPDVQHPACAAGSSRSSSAIARRSFSSSSVPRSDNAVSCGKNFARLRRAALETEGLQPASQFPISAKKLQPQPASFQYRLRNWDFFPPPAASSVW